MLLEKQYSGGLIATGTGEMLTAVTDTKGSASYVAIEAITGVLQGKKGSFVVHHTGTMAGGVDQLSIAIVPDSGTEELTGIAGTLSLKVVEGQHVFELEYSLAQ
jgi:LDH2 family malate/lactate/ureidoglycolate dehydrogenase